MFYRLANIFSTCGLISAILFTSGCLPRNFNSKNTQGNNSSQIRSISTNGYTIGLSQTREYIPGLSAYDFIICKIDGQQKQCELLFENNKIPLMIVNLKFMEKNNLIKKDNNGKYDEAVKIMISQKITDFISKWDRSTLSRVHPKDFTAIWETCFDLVKSDVTVKPTNLLCLPAGFVGGIGTTIMRVETDDKMKAYAKVLQDYLEPLVDINDKNKSLVVTNIDALEIARAMLYIFDQWTIHEGLGQEWYEATTRNVNYK